MAWTAITDLSTGDLVTETIWDDQIKANLEYLKDSGVDLTGCRATRAANQAVGAGAETTITFPTEDWDSDTMHDVGSNTERITIKETGYYVIVAHATTSASGVAEVRIKKNAGATLLVHERVNASNATTTSTTVLLAADDYLFMTYENDQAGNVNPAFLVAVRVSTTI